MGHNPFKNWFIAVEMAVYGYKLNVDSWTTYIHCCQCSLVGWYDSELYDSEWAVLWDQWNAL